MKQGKYLLTSLLIAACILATVLFFTITPTATYTLSDLEDLNSTLDLAIEAAGLPLSEFKKTHLEIDSTFSRSVYEIKVHPSFSKTSFHLALNHQLHIYNIDSPAKVLFPEENMHIHLIYNGTIFRTIRLTTNRIPKNTEDNG